jgi:hypothetical protein
VQPTDVKKHRHDQPPVFASPKIGTERCPEVQKHVCARRASGESHNEKNDHIDHEDYESDHRPIAPPKSSDEWRAGAEFLVPGMGVGGGPWGRGIQITSATIWPPFISRILNPES